MFSYYGSKSKLVHLYPPPKYTRIIEPFAGSARYSLMYFDREILLVDKFETVIKIWHYLQKCSRSDILGLPKLTKGMKISELNISSDEKLFLGMCAGVSSLEPRNTVSQFAAEQNSNKNYFKRVADQLYKIKHWIVKQGDYSEIPNQSATWFIDAPYQKGGQHYVINKIDFQHLSIYAKSRTGQVIVAENDNADWLPFAKISSSRGSNQLYTNEVIWSNLPTCFDNQQLSLTFEI